MIKVLVLQLLIVGWLIIAPCAAALRASEETHSQDVIQKCDNQSLLIPILANHHPADQTVNVGLLMDKPLALVKLIIKEGHQIADRSVLSIKTVRMTKLVFKTVAKIHAEEHVATMQNVKYGTIKHNVTVFLATLETHSMGVSTFLSHLQK